MCAIAGIINLARKKIVDLPNQLQQMNDLQQHRGPDGAGIWVHSNEHIGFAHRRLAVIDIAHAAQPMQDKNTGNVVCFNGEIYNFKELKRQLIGYQFVTNSDTEVILAAYQKWGKDCLNYFKGMFAFALWDEQKQELFCARDHFGIKPFYYAIINDNLYFSSEVKALLPFLPNREFDLCAVKDYLSLQLYLGDKTLFKGVKNLLPAHSLEIKSKIPEIKKYWEIYYREGENQNEKYYAERLDELLHESIKLHTVSDVPIGSYISGGVDSSLVAAIASEYRDDVVAFTGRFDFGELYDESKYAVAQAEKYNLELNINTITEQQFHQHINDVMHYMDYPAAGPGVFPQYMMSEFVATKRKVVLGGQGGDEIFGGYTRYLIGYLEQAIKSEIDGSNADMLPIPLTDIINRLPNLKNYKPLIKSFWSNNLFGDPSERYFDLKNRAPDLHNIINWEELPKNYNPLDEFKKIFNADNVETNSYFDRMLHFDFKVLLPHLLQVEDRMSMAHGVEARVPLLYRELAEFAAQIPNKIKYKEGRLKSFFLNVAKPYLADSIINRKDKMGFPFPVNDWIKVKNSESLKWVKKQQNISSKNRYGRSSWGISNLNYINNKYIAS